jgi:hypothetical protein
MEDPLRELDAAIRRIFPITATLGLYEESLALLRHMENRFAKVNEARRTLRTAYRVIKVPIFLLLRGFEQVVSGLGTLYLVVSVLAIAGMFVSDSLPRETSLFVQNAAILGSLFAVLLYLFAAPSTYCAAGVNGKHVAAVRAKLSQTKFNDAGGIEMILRNLKIFDARTNRRLAAYRWTLGAVWAIYFAPAIGRLIGAPSGNVLANRESIASAWVAFLALFVISDCYARGVDILFRSLELGCNEQLGALKREQMECAGPGLHHGTA